jgi:hypothetical protein
MQNANIKTETPPLAMVYAIFAIVAGLVLPFLLIPLVKFTGYSEIVEETAKALVALFLILKLPSHKMRIFVGIGFGFLFGVSESIFYLNNIFQLGDFSVFWQRFLWTVPMHIATVLMIVFSGIARRRFVILGLLGAMVLHLLFNKLATGVL